MTRIHATLILTLAMAPLLVGCGTSKSDRALSGGGIGAAAGTVGSAVAGGNPVAGAVVGGAAGALTGALTDPDKLNLGKPLWRR